MQTPSGWNRERLRGETQCLKREIRCRAYEIYLERAEQPGSELDDWFRAERELEGKLLAQAS